MMNKKIVSVSVCMVLALVLFSGCSSLTRSASRGDLDGIKEQLEKGVDINQYDKWGWTPIMWAIYYNYYDIVKYMLEHKADSNARTLNDYGSIVKDSTPLIIAAMYGYGGIARQLLKHGARKSDVNRQGETAVSVAEKYNFIAIVDLLEGKGGSRYTIEKKDEADSGTDEGNQTILMNDGSKIVGKIVSQTRTQVTVKTKYSTITIEKDKISEMKYK